MDPSFSSSPAPYPAGGTLGLLQVSCPSLEVGGGSPHPAFQAAAVSPPSNPTCTAVELRVPSTGTDLPKAEHHSPLSPPHGRNPQHWRWATVSHALHFTHTALSSQQCQVYYEESQSLIFCVCFYQIPSFLPTSNLLAGTKSLNPWNVIPTSRFTGTDPSVTSQSSFFSLSLPCGATLWCMHACCVWIPLVTASGNFSPMILQCNSVNSKRYREEPFLASHTPCDIRKCGYLLLQTSSMSQWPKTIKVYFLLTS